MVGKRIVLLETKFLCTLITGSFSDTNVGVQNNNAFQLFFFLLQFMKKMTEPMWAMLVFGFDSGLSNNTDLSIFQGSSKRIRSMAGNGAFGMVCET